MTRWARRRRLRALGAGVAALAAGLALLVGVEATGNTPHAAANPTGAVPSVYVVGGGSSQNESATVDAFRLTDIQADPAAMAAQQHTTSPTIVFPIVAEAITPGASRVLLAEEDDGDGDLGWTLQVLTTANGAVSEPAENPTETRDVVAVATNPTTGSNGYVLTSDGSIWNVNLTTNPPVISNAAVSHAASLGQGQANTFVVSANGLTAYVGGWALIPGTQTAEDFIDAVPLAAGGQSAQWTGPAHGTTEITIAGSTDEIQGVADLAFDPDGSRLVAVDVGSVFGVGLPLPASNGLTFGPEGVTSTAGNVEAVAVTIRPDGSTIYAGGVTQQRVFDPVVDSYSPGGALEASDRLPQSAARDGSVSMAVTPDAHSLLVTVGGSAGTSSAFLDPVALGPGGALAGPAQGIVLTNGNNTGGSDPALGPTSSPQAIAVTPDQAPVAAFGAAVAPAGSATTFNANSSSVKYGTITTFRWNFGDGNTATTGSPVVSHAYGAPGNYTVSVTETDSAGTSVPPAIAGFSVDSAGQTPYKRALGTAAIAHTITVPSGTKTTTSATTKTTTTTKHTTTTTKHTTTTTKHTTTTTKHNKAPTPTLTLNPGLGPPGTIVTVTGKGFPASTPITISWSTSTGSIVVTTDAHGNLPKSQLMILTPDVLGPRNAVASSTPQAEAPFLVVPSTDEPGGDDGSLLFRSESL